MFVPRDFGPGVLRIKECREHTLDLLKLFDVSLRQELIQLLS